MNITKRIYCRAVQLVFRAALPILPYRQPKLLSSTDDVAQLLRQRKIRSILLVADAGVRSLGLTDALEESLRREHIVYSVYEQRTPNPTIDDVEQARAQYRLTNAKAIVAIGGGSAIDCAKVVGARIARPKKPVTRMRGLLRILKPTPLLITVPTTAGTGIARPKKPVTRMRGLLRILKPTPLLITVPTTAGTGSETTLAAVITDGKTHHKYPINDFALIPDYAVLDARLTLGLPPHLTATTGMDALTHAVEAYIGRSTTRFTRSMAEKAVRLIAQNLQTAHKNGANLRARENMLHASYCAGIAFTRSYVGYVHGIAHSLGGQYGIAHGLANAVILPHMLRRYGASCEKKLARLAMLAGIVPESAGTHDAAQQFIRWIEQMNREFGLETGFSQIREEDIPLMAMHADKECNPLYPVPMLMDRRELEAVYHELTCKEELRCALKAS